MTKPRRVHLALSALLLTPLAAIALLSSPVPRKPKKPNVVLLLVDTLRADHLSHFGYHRPTAAPLDDFAAQATVFTRAYAPAPWTAPSAASLHTGLFPTGHGLLAKGDKLDARLLTIAEALKARGWHTLGHSFNHHVSSKTGFDQGFSVFDDFLGHATAYPDISRLLPRVGNQLDSMPGGPFFLYLHPMNVHGPYKVPKPHRADLLGRPPSRKFVYYGRKMRAILQRGDLEVRKHVGPRMLQSLVDQYDTAIRYSFAELAKILDLLKERDLYDDSLIVLTADHGEELFEHGGFSHGYSLHEELLHVPLYIKLPRQKRPRRIGTPVSLLDIYPTIVDLLDIPGAPGSDGHSLLPLLQGRSGEAPARQHFVHLVDWKARCRGRALANERFKLVEVERNYEGLRNTTMLYDRRNDPNESINLAQHKPELVKSMRSALQAALKSFTHTGIKPVNVLDKLDKDRLQALGYGQ